MATVVETGTDDPAQDDVTLAGLISNASATEPTDLILKGKWATDVRWEINKPITIIGESNSRYRTTYANSQTGHMFLWCTTARTGVTSQQSRGEPFPGSLPIGTDRVTFATLPPAWADVREGDWMQLSGGIDPRPNPQGNNLDAIYGEPIRILEITGNTLIFQSPLRDDCIEAEDGNVYFQWVPRIKRCGIKNFKIETNGQWVSKFCDVQGFEMSGLDIENGQFARCEASFDGIIKDGKCGQSGANNAQTGIRVSFGCANLDFSNLVINSKGNAIDGAGGAGICPHKSVVLRDSVILDSNSAGTTAPIRTHAAGGGLTIRNNYIEANTYTSQQLVNMEAIHNRIVGNEMHWNIPTQFFTTGVVFQAGLNSFENNQMTTNASGIRLSSAVGRITERLVIKGNDFTHTGGRSNSLAINLNAGGENVDCSKNTIRGFARGIYNAGDDDSTNRAIHNLFIDVDNETEDLNGSPGSEHVFQYNVSNQKKKVLSFIKR